jgi:hypothetical protein
VVVRKQLGPGMGDQAIVAINNKGRALSITNKYNIYWLYAEYAEYAEYTEYAVYASIQRY